MAQQTAVEWLGSYIMSYLSTHEETLSIIKRAKAMEKEQIINACLHTASTFCDIKLHSSIIEGETKLAEQYYNEIYKK